MDMMYSLEAIATLSNEECRRVLPNFVKDWMGLRRDMSCPSSDVDNIIFNVPASEGYDSLPSIVLCAHHDVWSHGFWVGDRFFETGALDDRAGVLAILHGVDGLLKWWHGRVDHPQITLLFTDREETGFHGARQITHDHPLFSNVGVIFSLDGPVDWSIKEVEDDSLIATISGPLELHLASNLQISALKNGRQKLQWDRNDGPGDHTVLLWEWPDKVVNLRAPYRGNGEYHTAKESTSIELMSSISNWVTNLVATMSSYYVIRKGIIGETDNRSGISGLEAGGSSLSADAGESLFHERRSNATCR